MSKIAVGIDLGGTFIKFGLLDEQRRLLGEPTQRPTPVADGAQAVIDAMASGACDLLVERGVSRDDVVGAGIGSPGPLDLAEGLVLDTPNLPCLRDVALRERVGEKLGIPTALENDANAAAFGEFLCGAGKDISNMVMLTLGTGVGGGIIIDGRIVHGSHWAAGELGHMLVCPNGRPCGCGQRGCLEQYASATYLAQYAREALADDPSIQTELREVVARTGELTSKDICQARARGDGFAAGVWNEAMHYLAVGCITICRALDPDRIVLAGGMTAAGDELLAPLREHFRAMNWSMTAMLTDLSIAQLGSRSGVVGAAGVAWRQFGNGQQK
jgi:glucokinase